MVKEYPEPFSEEADAYSKARGVERFSLPDELADRAHGWASAPYGDEGAGYDTQLMAAILIDQGWTPPKVDNDD